MGYDNNRRQAESGGGSFVMGLLTGAFLGAGLGMLLAPKAGSELRHQLSDQADSLSHKAADQYGRVTEKAREWADRGREAGADVYDKARDIANQAVKSTSGLSEKFGPGNESGPSDAARPFGPGSESRRS